MQIDGPPVAASPEFGMVLSDVENERNQGEDRVYLLYHVEKLQLISGLKTGALFLTKTLLRLLKGS